MEAYLLRPNTFLVMAMMKQTLTKSCPWCPIPGCISMPANWCPLKIWSTKALFPSWWATFSVPALDNRPYRAATTSRAVVTGLLKEELCYEGLVLSDAMDMKGNHTFWTALPKQRLLRLASTCFCYQRHWSSHWGFKTYIDTGFVSIDRLDESVNKILNAKWDYGVFAEANIQPPSPSALVINTPASSAFEKK